MNAALAPIAALLASVALLQAGNGLQGILLAVRASIEEFSTLAIGTLGSAHYVGFAVGCLLGPRVVRRVGHIRMFLAMAAVASALPLIHVLLISPATWIVLRAGSGLCFACLFLVIESWLNERSSNENRGAVFSLYLLIHLLVVSVGQMMLTLDSPRGFTLFLLTSILISVSAVPVALSTAVAPAPVAAARIRLARLYRLSPVGFVGCFAFGLATGSFWALGPVFGQRIGLGTDGVALFMSAGVLGGALGQWPIGRLSDRFDRRLVIAGACVATMLCAAGIVRGTLGAGPGVLALGAAYGFFAMPLYALSVAHANDHVAAEEFVEASSGLLLLFAAGAILGPPVAALSMDFIGAAGLFVFSAGIHGLTLGFALWRTRMREAPPAAEMTEFAEALQAVQTVSPPFETIDIADDDGSRVPAAREAGRVQ